MTDLPDFQRRLSRKIQFKKGMQLTADDIDMLVQIGVYDLIIAKTAEFTRKQCQHRSARSRSISGGVTPSIGGKTGKTSRSSGTTPSESANEALAQAQEMLGLRSAR